MGAIAQAVFGSPEEKAQRNQARLDRPMYEARNELLGRARGLMNRQYTAFQGDRVAGLSGNERMAGQQAEAFARRQQGFQPGDLSRFENPYLDQVLKNRQRAIGEEYGRQSASLAKNQTAMDAFRSGRSDLARSRLDQSRMQALDDAEAESRAAAFESSMNNYFRDQEGQRAAFDVAQRNLMATGMNERSLDQAQADFDYGQFLEKRDWDVNNLTPLLNALAVSRGSPLQTGGSGSNGAWGAVAGLAATAVGQWLSQPNYSAGTATRETHSMDNGATIATWRPSIVES